MESAFPKPSDQTRDEDISGPWTKGEFIAMMGHDLRISLAGITGFLELLGVTDLTEEQRACLDAATESARDLQEILDGILECLRSDAGRLVLHERAMDLAQFLGGVMRGFAVQASRNGIEIQLDMSDAAGVWRFDPVKLRQILANLVSNALKFTAAGAVTLRAARSRSGGVRLEVSDTGQGIPPHQLAGVFDAFQQGDGGEKGHGLGLAIVKKLAQALHGEVQIQSRSGHGTRVILEFPWRQESPSQT